MPRQCRRQCPDATSPPTTTAYAKRLPSTSSRRHVTAADDPYTRAHRRQHAYATSPPLTTATCHQMAARRQPLTRKGVVRMRRGCGRLMTVRTVSEVVRTPPAIIFHPIPLFPPFLSFLAFSPPPLPLVSSRFPPFLAFLPPYSRSPPFTPLSAFPLPFYSRSPPSVFPFPFTRVSPPPYSRFPPFYSRFPCLTRVYSPCRSGGIFFHSIDHGAA